MMQAARGPSGSKNKVKSGVAETPVLAVSAVWETAPEGCVYVRLLETIH